MALRPCSRCRRLFDDGGNARRAGGKCPDCRRAGWRAHQATRVEHGSEYGHAWRVLRQAVLERDDWACAYCGAPANTADAVYPRSRGGATSIDNLVACCAHCNTSKGGRTIAEWIASGCAPPGASRFAGEVN